MGHMLLSDTDISIVLSNLFSFKNFNITVKPVNQT